MPKITCPHCGTRGDTGIGSAEFEVRGQLQGTPVRKCLKCGVGMTVVPSLRGAKAKLIEPELWYRMKQSWARELEQSELVAGDNDESELDDVDEGGGVPDVVTCAACSNTGNTAAGSSDFYFRAPHLGRPIRVCAACGTWLFLQHGTSPRTEEVPVHVVELSVVMHQVIRPDASEEDVRHGELFRSATDVEDDDGLLLLEEAGMDDTPTVSENDSGTPATVGDSLEVPFDSYEETRLRITLDRFDDLRAVNGFAASDDGRRYVAFFTVENLSPLTFNDSLTNAELALEGRDDTEMTNELFDDVTLAPSQKLQGYVTFDVDSAATPIAIRFTPSYAGSTGVWKLPRLPDSLI